MNKNFKFSIVIAIYNMENYLTEAIDSLINQSIGFEDNLQILLVNDGSVDNSEKICKSYVAKYPENIVYMYKENGGVSDARNKGLEYVTGELVNFLDADDKLQNDALEKVYAFFEQNKDKVDLISIPLWFFEDKEGDHVLNYKFTTTRVVDIFEEPKCFQMHISSSFIKNDEIKKYRFNTKLKLGEDAEITNKVILNKGRYGVVVDTKYMYRKRYSGDSVIQGAKTNKENYIPPLKYLHLELIEFAKNKYDKVPEYLQWLIMYDIGGKIVVPHINATILEQSEIEEFLCYVKQVLKDIDDGIILGRTDLRRYYNLYLLNLKYEGFQKEKFKIVSNKEDVVLCIDNHIVDMLYRQKLHVNHMDIQDNNIRLSGYFNFLFDLYDFKLFIDSNGVETEIVFKENQNYQVTSLNQFVAKGYEFYVEIPFDGQNTSLKLKALVGKAKVQISLLIERDEVTNVENKSDKLIVDKYKISSKNKIIEITKESLSKSNEENNNNNEKVLIHKKKDKRLKLYVKNRILPKCIVLLLDLFEKIGNKKLLSRVINEIPANYRYCLIELKRNRGSELNLATTFNQACLYNRDGLLLTKMTDTKILVEKYKINENKLILEGSITSPFKSNMYNLNCVCNEHSLECILRINQSNSIKLFGENVVECNEFAIEIPINEENELYFNINMGITNIVPQFEVDEIRFIDKFKKDGYMVKFIDKKKIMLFY